MSQVVKFLLEGLAVATATHLVTGGKIDIRETVMLGLTAATVFMVLDFYAPSIIIGVRQGAGFGIGINMVGGNPASSLTEVEESSTPYKLVNGLYSYKALLAGFNQHAEAANSLDNCKDQAPWVDEDQVGGSTTGAFSSGDLVDIVVGDQYLQRGANDSQIIFDKALPIVNTNLSKLRFVHPEHSKSEQIMLQYGDPVYIMHNVYHDNMNVAKFVKYGDRLQSHQDGSASRVFKIYDAANKERKGTVEYGSEVYICRGDQEGENVFLKVEDDKSVSSENPVDMATRFKITLKRAYETQDRNLCICPDEVIFP